MLNATRPARFTFDPMPGKRLDPIMFTVEPCATENPLTKLTDPCSWADATPGIDATARRTAKVVRMMSPREISGGRSWKSGPRQKSCGMIPGGFFRVFVVSDGGG